MFRRSLLPYSKIGVFLISLLFCFYAKSSPPEKIVITIPDWIDVLNLSAKKIHQANRQLKNKTDLQLILKIPVFDGETLEEWKILLLDNGKVIPGKQRDLYVRYADSDGEEGYENLIIDYSDTVEDLDKAPDVAAINVLKTAKLFRESEDHYVLFDYKPFFAGKKWNEKPEIIYGDGEAPYPEAFYFVVKLRHTPGNQKRFYEVVDSIVDDVYEVMGDKDKQGPILNLNDHWMVEAILHCMNNFNVMNIFNFQQGYMPDIIAQLHVSSQGITTLTFTTVVENNGFLNEGNMLSLIRTDFKTVPVVTLLNNKLVIKMYDTKVKGFISECAEVPLSMPSKKAPFFFSKTVAAPARRSKVDSQFPLVLDKYNHELIVFDHHIMKGVPGLDCEYSVTDNICSSSQPAEIPDDENYEQPHVSSEQLVNTPIHGHSDSGSAERNHPISAGNYYNDKYTHLGPRDKIDSDYEIMDAGAFHQRTGSNVSATSSNNSGSGGTVTRSRTGSQLSRKEKEGVIRIGEQSLLHYVYDTRDDLFSINSSQKALVSGEHLLVQELEGVKIMLTGIFGSESKAMAISPQIKALFNYNQLTGGDKRTGKKKHGANVVPATTVPESVNSMLNSWVKLLRESKVNRIISCPVCTDEKYCPCDKLDSVLQEAHPELVALKHITKKK